ncbi:MAG: hypothetical protein GC200_10070 [Tepidisphaera sp.]|nr:hypothetical protein [Tepidisphaera sp.]
MPPVTIGMQNPDVLLFFAALIQVVFVFAFGACIGSLLNVLVYRLPLGLDVVTPQSRCPNCETRLTWRENVPIFGWLMLRGRCAFCRVPISPEYPIVETFTALLWSVVWLVLYSDNGRFLWVHLGLLGPSWGHGAMFGATWPLFIVVVILFSCLIAVTIIDARTFHIPMALNWAPVVVALLAHPLWALWRQYHGGGLPNAARGWDWAIATPGPGGWLWIGGSIGGAVGLLLSNALLAAGVFKMSFADYDQWLAAEEATRREAAEAKALEPKAAEAGDTSPADEAAATPAAEPANPDSPEMWIAYPHARREMVRELIFLAPCVGLGLLGAAVAAKFAGPWHVDPLSGVMTPKVFAPLWLEVLAGVLMGYIIGGGLVWLMRIAGTLALGKEAMGLGDVHLMAAVGACLGWIDSALGFVGAAFVGAGWAFLGVVFGGALKRHMPFGPYLAIATVLVWFLKPLIERLLGVIGHLPGPMALP